MAKGTKKPASGAAKSSGSENPRANGATDVNRMVLNGKKNGIKDHLLEIELSDDYRNVAGFGQPVTESYARKMVRQYCEDVLAAQRFIKDVEKDFSGNADFERLKLLLSEDRHIVSGVFGKEIILQILAQPRCEGIRYMFGKYKSQTTIILKGVTEVKEGTSRHEAKPIAATSKPLDHRPANGSVRMESAGVLRGINGEVHRSSLTISQLMENVSGLAEAKQPARKSGKAKKSGRESANRFSLENGAPVASADSLTKKIFGEY